jgi:hypothetical protein
MTAASKAEGTIMNDENRTTERSDMGTSSPKQPWTQPRIESVEGRQASGSVFSYGGPDSGIYS